MRRKRFSRKRKKNDSYLIIILFCLLVLNAGALFFRMVVNAQPQDNANLITKIFEGLNLSKAFKFDDDEIIQPPSQSITIDDIEDEGELNTSEDYIIDRLQEYESLIIIKDNYGISSIENIPEPLNIKKISLKRDENYILMYHTHGSEAYLTDDASIYHNSDINKNVVSVGNVLQTVLEANGHKVDHVQTLHDLPSYNQSYTRSLNTINNKKTENSNLKILLDIHRDGVDKDAEYKERFLKTARIDINGVSTATFSLVVGPDTPNYESVLSFAKYIKVVSDALYPDLCTGIIVKPRGKYNLYASDYSALIEIGSNLVTQEEANESAKLIGEILSLVLDSILE